MIFEAADKQKLSNKKKRSAVHNMQAFDRSWFVYLARLAKHPLKLELPGKITEFVPVDQIVISPKFFRNFTCNMCGRCCTKIDTPLFYTKPEIRDYDLIASDMEQAGFSSFLAVISDDKKNRIRSLHVTEWSISQGSSCVWLGEDNKCVINEIKPIQCKLSPVYVDIHRRKIKAGDTQGHIVTARLTKRLIGRYWRFGCKMLPSEFNPTILTDDIKKLRLLLSIAEYLDIDTWLPEIIDKLVPCVAKYHPIWNIPVTESVIIKPLPEKIIR